MYFSQREEPFRYEFEQPLDGKFQITGIDGKRIQSKTGELKLIDLSWHGAKILSDYDFHIHGMEIELTLRFTIVGRSFVIPGVLVHQHREREKYIYGLYLKTEENVRGTITEELKAYAWKLVEQKAEDVAKTL